MTSVILLLNLSLVIHKSILKKVNSSKVYGVWGAHGFWNAPWKILI